MSDGVIRYDDGSRASGVPVSSSNPLPVVTTSGGAGFTNSIAHAVETILDVYGDTVTIKDKTLRKFGRNDDIDADVQEMVWLAGGIETLPTGNTINTLVSTNAGDGQTVTIEGHTLSGGDLTFVSQTATLNGTTNVTLTTPLARATRIINTGTTDFAGTVTVFVNGGDTHLSTSGSNNQSLKAATAISSQDYWVVNSWSCSVLRANAAIVDFKFQVSPVGGVFTTKGTCSVSRDAGTVLLTFDPPIIVPKNSDVRVLATSSAANTQVDSTINGYLALVSS